MLHQRFNIQALRIVDRAIVFDDADDLETGARHQLGRHAAHVAEALDDHASIGHIQAESPQSLHGDDHAAASGSLRAPARSAQRQRLSRNHACHRVAFVHGISVHDPRHGLWIGIDIGRRHIALGPDDVHDLRGIAARDALQFTGRQQVGIANHSAFGAAEGNIHHRAFPCHPGGQGPHFVQRHIRRETDSAFGRTAHDGMMHTIAGENFVASVVQHHRDADLQLERGHSQNLAQAFVQAQQFSGFVEARLSGNPRIGFLFRRRNRF